MKFLMGWRQRKPRPASTFEEQQHISEGKKKQSGAGDANEDVFHAYYGNTVEGLMCHHIQINGLLAIGTLGLIEEDMATSTPDHNPDNKWSQTSVSEQQNHQLEYKMEEVNQKQQYVAHQGQLLLVSNAFISHDMNDRVAYSNVDPASHDMNNSFVHPINIHAAICTKDIDSSKCISDKSDMNKTVIHEADELDSHPDSSNVHSNSEELSQMAYSDHPFIKELLAASLYICEAAALPSTTGRKDAKQHAIKQQQQFHGEKNDYHQKNMTIVGSKQEPKKQHRSKISKIFPSTFKSAMLNVTPSYLTKYLSKSGLSIHEASPAMDDMNHPKKLQKFLRMFRKKKMYGMTQSLPRELDIFPHATKDDDDDQYSKSCTSTSRSYSSSSSSSSLSTSSFFSNDPHDMKIVPNRRSNAYLISTDDEFVVIEL